MSRRERNLAIALGAVILVGLGMLWSNPRHRAFYFGRRPGPSSASGLGEPSAAPAVSPVAALAPGRRVPLPDAAGRIVVPVASRASRQARLEEIPPGWTLKEFAGRASVEVVRAETGAVLSLRSMHASFALYRDVIADLREFPLLSWSWKVVRLPAAGDVRHAATDDEAAQVYVIFPRWPLPFTNSDVIGYVWDSRAPVGTRLTSPKAANVRIIVVESGTGRLGVWQRQERNVAADYAALFGRQPPRVGQVAVMIDSDDTRGDAVAPFGDLVFTRGPTERTEIPTSMLR